MRVSTRAFLRCLVGERWLHNSAVAKKLATCGRGPHSRPRFERMNVFAKPIAVGKQRYTPAFRVPIFISTAFRRYNSRED